MIILEPNNILKVDHIGNAGKAVVAYWLVDAGNVWTTHSEFTSYFAPTADTVILTAPSAGERKVVENIWVQMEGSTVTNHIWVEFFEGMSSIILGGFSDMAQGAIVTMARDGVFSLSNALTGP